MTIYEQEHLYRRFIKFDFKIGKPFCSPLRDEQNPSFCIFYATGREKLLWKDHGMGIGGNVYQFIMQLYNCPYEEIGAIIKGASSISMVVQEGRKIKEPEQIRFSYNTFLGFRDKSLSYWQDYGISREILDLYKVSDVSSIFKNGNRIFKNMNQLCFCFPSSNGEKFYFPDGHYGSKFLNNLHRNHLWGIEHLFDHDFTIISKSNKDMMTLRAMGIPAIAVQSENFLFSEQVADFLLSLPNPIIFYDNDRVGMEWAMKNKSYYGIPFIYLKTQKQKDISDFVKAFGLLNGKDEIYNLIFNL